MRMNRAVRWILLPGFLLGVLSPPLAADTADPPVGAGPPQVRGGLALSLREAILRAFENHAEIIVAREEIPVQGAGISVAKSVFDPRFVGGVNYRESEIPTDSFVPGTNRNELAVSRGVSLGFSAEVNQRYFTGTRAALSLTTNRDRGEVFFQGFSFGRRTELRPRLGLSLTQSLLKGLSIDANTAETRLARIRLSMSLLDFRSLVDGVLADVEGRYWETVFARENLRVKEASLETAESVLRISEARFRVGDAPRLDVITAQAGVAAQKEGIIRARNDLEDARDRLARVVFPSDAKEVGTRTLTLTDEPTRQEVEVSLDASIRTALEKRPDLEKARSELLQTTILRSKSEHERLPSLDLTGSVGLNGLGRDVGNAFSEMLSREYLDWGLSLSLEVPLGGNRLADANLRRARQQEKQARVRLKSLEAGIVYEVRQAVRAVQSARERERAAEASRVLAEERLEVEQAKLKEGATIANAVLEAQEDLLSSQTAEIRARIDQRLALSLLQKAESTLAERHDLDLPRE